jgi:hypothetical protein
MRNRIYITIMAAVFLFIFLWCPGLALSQKLNIISLKDNQNYKTPERVYESGFLNGIEEIKTALENIYTNYLPAYDRMVKAMQDIGSSMQIRFADMLSKFEPAPNIPEAAVISPDMEAAEQTKAPMPEFTAVYVGEEANRRFYAIRPYDFLESVMKLDEENLYKNMRRQIDGINRIIKANTDVNFYLYIGKTMQDAEYFNDIIPGELCTAAMFGEFMDGIEGAAGKDYFKIDTLEDRLAKQWRTDHHWNAAGSYAAYSDIINMINKNTPEIGGPIPIKEIKEYPAVQFRGSYAALSGFKNFYEDFFVYIYDLPGQGPSRYSMRSFESQYDSGNFDSPQDIFFDHYVNFYTDRRHYVYENNTGRNLLIIGDSLTYWSAWLIAANFDDTYLYFPWDAQTIDYNAYITEHKITDVLMMVYSQAGIFNVYGYCRYEQLQTP